LNAGQDGLGLVADQGPQLQPLGLRQTGQQAFAVLPQRDELRRMGHPVMHGELSEFAHIAAGLCQACLCGL
jgi:hypothetical protein